MEIKERLREKARAIGFDLFGVAPARPAATGAFFTRWLEAGYQGGMDYLSRRARERSDPRLVLPEARTIVCVGVNYHARDPGGDGGAPFGRVARYAWGEDYHRVLGKGLDELAEFLRRAGAAAARGYVDTGPVLEREYAARAGIGWFGKNTNLIREGTGSWILLGEIITDLEMEPDVPVPDRCGTCTRCIDACPSGAILEPYLVDSASCIAYLTIEHRGTIPRELRAPTGLHVFGCDICQEVCPWNRKAPETDQEAFRPREGVPNPGLVALLEMTEEEWRSWFPRSAIRRAGRQGLRRNAAVALGNSGDRSVVPALIRALGDPDPSLRAHVAWALGRLGDAAGEEALREGLETEQDPLVRDEIEAALGTEVVR